MKHNLLFISILAMLVFSASFGYAQTTYTKITSASQLQSGAKVLIVGIADDGSAYAMGYQKSNNRFGLSVNESSGTITTVVASDPTSATEAFEFEIGTSNGNFTIYDALNNGYLYAASSDGNKLKTQATLDANGEWDIAFAADGAAIPTAQGSNTRNIMRFNDSDLANVLFSCYGNSSSVVDPVYFYVAGGQPVIEPEPSNYPTNFAASANMLDITLTWIDATGSQLPSKYLVVGSTNTITVPVDGTPVADANLIANVAYGIQTVTFSNLNANTTYNFAIFPYTNSGDNIDYKTSGSYPTVSVTTADVYVLLNESFENGLGVFTAYDVYGDQGWQQGSYNGKTYAFINGYANGASNANEDWLISPAMNGEYAVINLQFISAMKFEGNALKLMISTDYDGVSEPSDFSWDDMTDMFDWSTGNYEWVESGSMNIESYAGLNFYIAFVYTSTAEASSAWEISDVKVLATEPLAVADKLTSEIQVFPNPANSNIRFNMNQDAQVCIFDMCGRMVREENLTSGDNGLNISTLENGVYFVSLKFADGHKAVSKFLKF
jgi:hypothetical protein